MESREEIQSNQFFLILKNLNSTLYKQAADSKYTICVPQGSTIGAVQMNEEFCKMHVLVHSKYFKSEYNNLLGQCVEIKNRQLTTKTGFNEPRTVDILFEELFYNDEYESFKVFCISAPFAGRIAAPSYRRSNRRHTTVGLRTESEWVEIFRKTFGHNQSVQFTRKLEKFAVEFNTSYVMVKGFTEQAGLKAFGVLEKVLDQLRVDDNHKDEIGTGLEVYLVSKIHHKVTTNLNKQLKSKNQQFQRSCDHMSTLTFKDLDIHPSISCNLTEACQTFSTIDSKTNPVSKVYCIFESCQQITSAVTTSGDSEVVLAADDMLMLFTLVLLRSSPPTIWSNLEYLSNFHRPRHSTAQLDYAYATLQGAVLYISEDLSKQHGAAHVKHRRSTNLVRVRDTQQAQARPARRHTTKFSRGRRRPPGRMNTFSENRSGVASPKPLRQKRPDLKFEDITEVASENPLFSKGFVPFTELGTT